jgi:hypothetical protein
VAFRAISARFFFDRLGLDRLGDLTGRDLGDHDRRADHVSRALLILGPLGFPPVCPEAFPSRCEEHRHITIVCAGEYVHAFG